MDTDSRIRNHVLKDTVRKRPFFTVPPAGYTSAIGLANYGPFV